MGIFDQPKIIKLKDTDLNIFVIGNFHHNNTFEEIKNIFSKTDPDYNGVLKLTREHKNCSIDQSYQCEYHFLKHKYSQDNKDFETKWSCFFIESEIERDILKVLLYYLHENDKENNKNNVIIFLNSWNQDNEVNIYDNVFKDFEKTNKVLNPFIIHIGNFSINEKELEENKLNFKNYIPNFKMLQKYYLNKDKLNLSKDKIFESISTKFKKLVLSKLVRIHQYYNQRGYDYNGINPFDYKGVGSHLTIALTGYSGFGKSTFINLNFGELVAKIGKSAKEVTTKATEYNLPIQKTRNNYNIFGQIRFIDFPGITKSDNYKKIIEPTIQDKIKSYKDKKESIDIALIFLKDGTGREDDNFENFLKLIELFLNNNIQLIFVMNRVIDIHDYIDKIQLINEGLKEKDYDEDVINEQNSIITNFRFDRNKRDISEIWDKILHFIKIREEICEDVKNNLTIENFTEKFQMLKNNSICFRNYENF